MLSRQVEFEKLWEGEGRRLLETTEAITGKTFRPQEITARRGGRATPSPPRRAAGSGSGDGAKRMARRDAGILTDRRPGHLPKEGTVLLEVELPQGLPTEL